MRYIVTLYTQQSKEYREISEISEILTKLPKFLNFINYPIESIGYYSASIWLDNINAIGSNTLSIIDILRLYF